MDISQGAAAAPTQPAAVPVAGGCSSGHGRSSSAASCSLCSGGVRPAVPPGAAAGPGAVRGRGSAGLCTLELPRPHSPPLCPAQPGRGASRGAIAPRHHPGRHPRASWAPGLCPLCSLCAPCLLAAGRGDPAHGDLADGGHYLYLDEDGPLEVLAGPARCQDTYRDWISLYCWAPFHAAVTATPEGSRCRWDHIGSIYSELSNCTEVLAEMRPRCGERSGRVLEQAAVAQPGAAWPALLGRLPGAQGAAMQSPRSREVPPHRDSLRCRLRSSNCPCQRKGVASCCSH
ncbi:receptor activity-modifying protein 2 isoform X4 [Apteryx mantelli]|uniref:Receptor activity-modifying protein 2 isoform X4 n=1 Tax=Apteryx mantelli TaxID=2696672 RepID=A0ABM4FSP7_9AVES